MSRNAYKIGTWKLPVWLMGLLALLMTSLSTYAKTFELQPVEQSVQQAISHEKQAYLTAVKNYNDFVEHPQGHVYNVRPKERKLELCYLSAQVVSTSVRVPEFASDRNADGEITEWRRWIDIRQKQLHC